jgi:sterol desaturase/sphingolipid hydroxylase (fatty acid hydroxylase superfamily)
MDFPIDAKTFVAVGALLLLWIGELLFPFYAGFRGRAGERLRHDGRNLTLGIANALLALLLFGGLLVALEVWAESQGTGLLRLVSWPVWLETAAAVVLFDVWMYAWHRLNHAVPFLWRFHRMHHSDDRMDATTGLRFHTGEVLMSGVARLAVLPLLGMTLWQLAVYEALLLPVVLFHHSNVRLPRWLDYGLLPLIVTPAMHRVHHSRWRLETDSNYGSIFPWWDRAWGTFRVRDDARTIRLGLDEFSARRWQTWWGLLKTPLAPLPKPSSPAAHRPPRETARSSRRLDPYVSTRQGGGEAWRDG